MCDEACVVGWVMAACGKSPAVWGGVVGWGAEAVFLADRAGVMCFVDVREGGLFASMCSLTSFE